MDIKANAAPYVHEKALLMVKKYVARGSKILDIAAGEGALSVRLKESGYKVVAADIDTNQFKPKDITVVRLDANNSLPFDDGEFDAVVSVETVEHLTNPFGFITEVERILRPGGIFILTTPNVRNIYSRILYLVLGRPFGFSDKSYRQTGHVFPFNSLLMNRWIRDNTSLRLVEKTYNCFYLPPFCLDLPTNELFGMVYIGVYRKTSV